ncbi:Ankyrin repeats-containing protein [Cardinium endosymbiont cBtQ1 of Bemisia tabaci]|nr:Ankyrin repeats-containing protein [Cardinium endosymbiont cBtQ1 of Bemisia tabaci]
MDSLYKSRKIVGLNFKLMARSILFSFPVLTGCGKVVGRFGMNVIATSGSNKGKTYRPKKLSTIARHCIQNAVQMKKLDKKDAQGRTLLHTISQMGDISLMEFLLKNKSNINERDKDGKTPTYWASEHNKVESVAFLLNHGHADVNQASKYGNTPLHVVSIKGYTEVAKVLLSSAKILVNLKNYHGETALYIALQNGHTEIVKLLLNDNRTKYDPFCSICLDRISHDILYITLCCHSFHKHCLKKWIASLSNKITRCPNCRQYIKAA